MRPVKIIADSTSDVPQDVREKYDISILPLYIILDEKSVKDDGATSQQDLFDWSDANKKTPKTSAPTLTDAIELIRPLTEQGNDVVAFCISKELSATYEVLTMAADEIGRDRVHVVDSRALSSGIGQQAVEAAISAKAGKSAAEIIEAAQSLVERVSTSFVINTATYLYRGGRCSAVQAVDASVLSIKPLIVMENGLLKPGGKYRGKIGKALLSYLEERTPELKSAKPDRIFVTHTMTDMQALSDAIDYIKNLGRFEEIIEARAGSVISSHCGPNTLGVLYVKQANA